MGNSTLSQVSTARLTANGTLSKSTKSANSIYQSIGKTASSDIDGLLKSAFDQLRSTGFDGVTGLEINKVKNMQNAITNYVDGIKKALSPLNAADARKAFGNQMDSAIEDFVLTIKKSCEALVTNMLAFREDLDAVKKAMEAKAATVNSAVKQTSNNINSAKSGWTYSSGGSN